MKTQEKTTEVATTEPRKQGPSDRFAQMVLNQFAEHFGNSTLEQSALQKRLIQAYFVKLDMVLKTAELNRMNKPEQYRDSVAVTWQNVNMEQLAVDVMLFSQIGLNPLSPNHLNLIPYKNNKTGKYDIGFLIGYKGMEVKARKYGLVVPTNIIIELVYANDVFTPKKKSASNAVETYEFEIPTPFDRGEIIGGFYYIEHFYKESNRLEILTLAEIEKRKPKYASAEFWGGEKDAYKAGKKTGEKEMIEGWFKEMCYKTIYRAAWNSITIDGNKIDSSFIAMENHEQHQAVEEVVHEEINEKANKTEIKIQLPKAEIMPEIKQADAMPANGQELPRGENANLVPGF